MSTLVLRYVHDESRFDPSLPRDDFGRLSIAATMASFAGTGAFWVQWQDIVEFAQAMRAHPIAADRPVVGQWGYAMLEGDDLILRLELAPLGARGDLVLRFELADDHRRHDRLRGSFATTPAEVDAFSHAILQMMDRRIDEAVLTGR